MLGRFLGRCQSGRRTAVLALVALVAVAGGLGCSDFFNPSLLRLFETSPGGGSSAFAGVSPPVGHIPLLFKNTARIADNVFRYVIQGDTVVRPEVVDELLRVNPQLTRDEVEDILQAVIDNDPVDLESLNVPPRVRLTVLVVNVNGGVQRLEFLTGLRIVRTEGGGGNTLPVDLIENTNNTYIVQCDIRSISIERIDVFIPVVLRRTAFLFDGDGRNIGEQCISFPEPQFDDLEADAAFDPTEGQFGTRRNYDPRFFPPPLTSLQCGAVVIIELAGDLFLPFRDVPNDCEPSPNPPADGLVPAVLFFDDETINQIPGRYSVKMTIRS